MYKHLYDGFKHWYSRGGTVYFYADPHFGDDEMKYLRKNYISDDEQVKRINRRVTNLDTLVILGDIGDVEYIKKLRGYKVLIKGNHDKGSSNYRRGIVSMGNYHTIEAAENAYSRREIDGFDVEFHGVFGYKVIDTFYEVYEGCLMIAPKIMLSHEPVEFKYALNIHGHDHAGTYSWNNHFNVCAEWIDYTPVSIKDIVKSGLLTDVPDIHRETIDLAINKTEKL